MISLISPTSIIIPRKKAKDRKVQLNLNTYRNLHYQLSNQAKVIYKDDMRQQLEGLVLDAPIQVIFKLYKKGKRILDKNNVYSIVAKFFYDALVHYGCVPDDSDDYIGFETYAPTVYGADSDYCEIEIYEND